MATFTLSEAVKLGLNDLQSGIAETIVTVAPGLGMLPFQTVSGNAYQYTREKDLVTAKAVAADGTITDSDALANNSVTIALTAISGQSDIPNAQLRQAIGANGGNDLVAIHLASAAKGVAREYLNRLINGTVSANGWDGLAAILGQTAFSAQNVDAGAAALSFGMLDDAFGKLAVAPQFLMGNVKAQNKIRALMRAAGGVTSIELNGKVFTSVEDVPFIRNDYCVDGELYVGTWGDGTNLGGLTGLTTAGDLFHVTKFDAMEGKDATRVRVIMDGGATVYSPKHVALLKNFI